MLYNACMVDKQLMKVDVGFTYESCRIHVDTLSSMHQWLIYMYCIFFNHIFCRQSDKEPEHWWLCFWTFDEPMSYLGRKILRCEGVSLVLDSVEVSGWDTGLRTLTKFKICKELIKLIWNIYLSGENQSLTVSILDGRKIGIT